MSELHYHVEIIDPAAHQVRVRLTVPGPVAQGSVFQFPAWVPGSYTIRDLARQITSFEASSGGLPCSLERVDKDTWRLAHDLEQALQIELTVYAYELTVRTSHVDTTHAFLNGTSLFLRVVGRTSQPHRVTFTRPTHACAAAWELATNLPRRSGDLWSFGTFEANNYDHLVDCPVEMGRFSHHSFDVCGTPHHLAITGVHDGDISALIDDVQAICTVHMRTFGRPTDLQSYLFLLTLDSEARGGLEHRDSTALLAKRDQMPVHGAPERSEAYLDLLGLFSHEYFHTWNVKRIKPRVFAPYDYQRENHTTLLWAFEGITSYFDDLGVLRAHRMSEAQYFTLLGRTITTVRRAPGRTLQTLANSSFDAWTKLYKPDANSINATISYYTKGALAALALDLHLRACTDNAVHLTTLMTALWERYGDGSGVAEDGVEALASELTGTDLSTWFDAALRSTADLPLEALFHTVGLELLSAPATGPSDTGGTPRPQAPDRADLGLRVGAHPAGARVQAVLYAGAAQTAGLAPDDVILAIDGLQVDAAGLFAHIARHRPGDVVHLHAFRRGVLHTFDVVLKQAPSDTWWLAPLEAATQAQLARRKSWLFPE